MGEHHVHRSLLREICDLIGSDGQTLREAHRAALELLAKLEENEEVEDFDGSVQRISSYVESGLASREDGQGPDRQSASVVG
jgi:hypothetical protein